MRLALINSTKGSYWNSCKTIQENLIRSLEMMGTHDQIIHFDYSQEKDVSSFVSEVLNSNIDEIFYIAHFPHPLEFIKKIKDISPGPLRITFLIFGTFTSWLNHWHDTFKILNDSNVRIICGSGPQANLLNKFIEGTVEVLPFPVDCKKFFPQKKTINNKLQLIYTGRLSFEKNIHYLIEYLFEAQDRGVLKDGFELKLLGHFDHVHRPLFNDDGLFGSYYFYLFDVIAQKVGKERFAEQIKFFNHCDHDELVNQLANSDIFISMSTFTFEDFGMAAAEALEMGLPALLTSWGGHLGLKSIYPEKVKLVNCEICDKRISPTYASFERELISILSISPRTDLGRLSIEMTSNRLVEVFKNSDFKSIRIKEFFHQVLNSSEKNFFNDVKNFKEVYEAYLID